MDSFKDDIKNFIENEIDADRDSGKVSEIVTRFPPEPNGYLHIGHAKSICLNFGLARQYGGRCHLRFDDTNPEKEEQEYIDSIKDNVRWLGFDWGEHLYYASDYYDKLYGYAVELIEKGLAYVDDLSADEIREYRGTLTERGKNSPWRDRGVKENLELFGRMKNGDFREGEKVLRAKIDMGSSNMNMRDPVIYRIKFAEHHRTGDKWCIYPMYDFTHCISDALEGITHSICTLEFEDHRPLYDWVLDNVSVPCHPRQIEFARLNLTHTVMSKRKLLRLVNEGHVSGWDDPRMPTLAGIRRRGYTPASVREFAKAVGVAKSNSMVDFAMLEYFVRDDLNLTAPRVMVVLEPLKVTIENYPAAKIEWLKAENNPNDPDAGEREIPFSREIYIEREDFMETPSKKFFRLAPGREVRLKHGYYITCTDVRKDDSGNVTELICRYDPESKGGWTADERKVKGTLHWVSAAHAVRGEIRLYGHLFADDVPGDSTEGGDFTESIDPGSLIVIENALMEPGLSDAAPGDKFQFLRKGYFCADPDAMPGKPVFNRIVGLKDSWAKLNR